MDDERIVRGATFGGIDSLHGIRIERIRTESVDRLRRKCDEASVTQHAERRER